MSIEFILLGVIVLVVLVDFIMNSRKKSSVDNVVDQIESGKELKSKSKFSFSLDYFIKRKRNVVSFFIFVHPIKIFLNYYFYRGRKAESFYVLDRDHPGYEWDPFKCINKYDTDLKWHIENIYDFDGSGVCTTPGEVWLFIPSFIILGVFVWLINDKIKAR